VQALTQKGAEKRTHCGEHGRWWTNQAKAGRKGKKKTKNKKAEQEKGTNGGGPTTTTTKLGGVKHPMSDNQDLNNRSTHAHREKTVNQETHPLGKKSKGKCQTPLQQAVKRMGKHTTEWTRPGPQEFRIGEREWLGQTEVWRTEPQVRDIDVCNKKEKRGRRKGSGCGAKK